MNWLSLSVLLVKELFKVCVSLEVPLGGDDIVSLVPLIVIWCEHAIIGILVNNDLGSMFSVGWVLIAQLGMRSEDICQSFTSQG